MGLVLTVVPPYWLYHSYIPNPHIFNAVKLKLWEYIMEIYLQIVDSKSGNVKSAHWALYLYWRSWVPLLRQPPTALVKMNCWTYNHYILCADTSTFHCIKHKLVTLHDVLFIRPNSDLSIPPCNYDVALVDKRKTIIPSFWKLVTDCSFEQTSPEFDCK